MLTDITQRTNPLVSLQQRGTARTVPEAHLGRAILIDSHSVLAPGDRFLDVARDSETEVLIASPNGGPIARIAVVAIAVLHAEGGKLALITLEQSAAHFGPSEPTSTDIDALIEATIRDGASGFWDAAAVIGLADGGEEAITSSWLTASAHRLIEQQSIDLRFLRIHKLSGDPANPIFPSGGTDGWVLWNPPTCFFRGCNDEERNQSVNPRDTVAHT